MVSENAVSEEACGYFLCNDVLMRKWTSPKMSSQDDWSSVFQIVIPSSFRPDILRLAHDHCLAGHLGIRKTWDRVFRHFLIDCVGPLPRCKSGNQYLLTIMSVATRLFKMAAAMETWMFLLLALLPIAWSFYVPGVAPINFHQNTPVEIKVRQ